MAIVTGMTADAITALINQLVKTGAIDGSGNLTLTTYDGTVISLGSVVGSLPTATTANAGIVELASTADITAGTDTSKAVTPAELASRTPAASTGTAGLVALAVAADVTTGTSTTKAVTPAALSTTVQPLDSDLTAIAAIAPANDDVIQRKSGSWINRTMNQLATDLANAWPFTVTKLYNGTSYLSANNTDVYVGNTDPGSGAANGSVWFDTSGT